VYLGILSAQDDSRRAKSRASSLCEYPEPMGFQSQDLANSYIPLPYQRMAFHSVWLPSGAKNAMRSVYWLAAYQAYPPAKMPEVWLDETQMDWFILLAPRAPMSTPICQDQSWHVRDMMKTLGTPWAADRFKQSFQTSETLHFLRSRCQRFPQLAAGLPKHGSTPNNWHDWHVSDICVYL
jgi:hypothetical protein